ncbi:MAG: MmcQ/YjbR family DNA-binding protein, partial [Balneolaceae bacterium]
PGYHMNKKHWNTVSVSGNLEDDLIFELIKHSYDLVVENLPKKDRERLTK